jgi:hypothetical protein
MNALRMLVSIVTVAACSGCSTPGSAWKAAQQNDTIAAYGNFLSEYPSGPQADLAIRRIDTLQDDEAWDRAQGASTIEGFQAYLEREPYGKHAESARDNITMRERSAAWHQMPLRLTTSALHAFLAQYPTGPEADEARLELQRLAGYRAVLGSAASERSAAQKQNRLEHRFRREFPTLRVLYPDETHTVFRISSLPMSEEAATQACVQLNLSGQECRVTQHAETSPLLIHPVAAKIKQG